VLSALQEGKVPQLKNLDTLLPPELLKSLPPAKDVIRTLTPLVETAARMAKNTDFSKVSAARKLCFWGLLGSFLTALRLRGKGKGC
jgi:hypothetical protein